MNLIKLRIKLSSKIEDFIKDFSYDFFETHKNDIVNLVKKDKDYAKATVNFYLIGILSNDPQVIDFARSYHYSPINMASAIAKHPAFQFVCNQLEQNALDHFGEDNIDLQPPWDAKY